MRTIFTFFFSLVLLTAAAQGRGAGMMKSYNEKLASELHLDSLQQAKVSAVNQQYLAALADAMREKGAPREKTSAIKTARQTYEGALQAVLSPAQWKQYESMREEQRHKLAETASAKMAEEVTMTQQEKLALTAEQSTAAYPINTAFLKETFLALTDNDERGLQKLRTLKTAADNRNEAMKKLLSAEQYTKFLQLNEEQRAQMRERLRNRKG